MKQYLRSTFAKALRTYLAILPFAVIGGITVGLYMIEHTAPEVIETAVAQMGSYQALIAVTTIQSLVYSLFAWVVGYFIADRLDSDSLFSAEWFICLVFWKVVSQVWYSVCNVRTFWNSFHI